MGQQCSFCGTASHRSSLNLSLENLHNKKSALKQQSTNIEHSKENGHGGLCKCPEPEWEEDSTRPSGRRVKKPSMPEEIYEAAICGNEESIETIESFLVRGNPNAVNEDGYTILSLACENGFEKIVQIIMKKPNLHLNSKDHLGSTPLISAAWAGKTECARLLITIPHSCGLNIGATDNEGRTAMWWAAQNHRFTIIDLLFEHHKHEQKDLERILIPAAKCGQNEWVSKLLNPPYEIDSLIRNTSGHSAFWYAVAYECWEAAHIIHQKIISKNNNNTNNNSSNNNGNITQLDKGLCKAITMGQPAQLKPLLEEEQTQQNAEKHFDMLLLLAAESTSAQVLRILCQKHSYNTKALEAARSIAETIGYEKTVEMFDYIIKNHDLSDPYLDSVGAERQPCKCSSPYKGTLPATVWLAASNGQLPKVKSYVEKGGYVNMKQETGDTLLSVACRYGHASMVKYLLTRPELHLNTRTTKWGGDYTGLLVAAAKGHANIIPILAKSNHLCAIDMDAVDGEGNTALRLAVQEGEWEAVEGLLKEYSHHRKEDLEHAYSEAVEAEETETIDLLTSAPYNMTS